MSWKSVKVNSTENVITTAMSGDSIGNVMWRKRCQGVAPSSVAASCSEGEMVWSPASRVMATNGMPRQTFVKMTVARALLGEPKKLMGEEISPSFMSDQEITENCVS